MKKAQILSCFDLLLSLLIVGAACLVSTVAYAQSPNQAWLESLMDNTGSQDSRSQGLSEEERDRIQSEGTVSDSDRNALDGMQTQNAGQLSDAERQRITGSGAPIPAEPEGAPAQKAPDPATLDVTTPNSVYGAPKPEAPEGAIVMPNEASEEDAAQAREFFRQGGAGNVYSTHSCIASGYSAAEALASKKYSKQIPSGRVGKEASDRARSAAIAARKAFVYMVIRTDPEIRALVKIVQVSSPNDCKTHIIGQSISVALKVMPNDVGRPGSFYITAMRQPWVQDAAPNGSTSKKEYAAAVIATYLLDPKLAMGANTGEALPQHWLGGDGYWSEFLKGNWEPVNYLQSLPPSLQSQLIYDYDLCSLNRERFPVTYEGREGAVSSQRTSKTFTVYGGYGSLNEEALRNIWITSQMQPNMPLDHLWRTAVQKDLKELEKLWPLVDVVCFSDGSAPILRAPGTPLPEVEKPSRSDSVSKKSDEMKEVEEKRNREVNGFLLPGIGDKCLTYTTRQSGSGDRGTTIEKKTICNYWEQPNGQRNAQSYDSGLEREANNAASSNSSRPNNSSRSSNTDRRNGGR